MTETQIELSGSCHFTLTTYENIGHKDVCLDYTEHSSDHWHSDSETSIPLDADKAREIVAFMHKAFPEIEQPAQPQQEPTVPATAYDRLFALNEANAARIIELEAAQPEQEPVAVARVDDLERGGRVRALAMGLSLDAPLYTSPPAQRKPLTDEDLIECERSAGIRHRIHMGSIRGQQLSPADQFLWNYARAIEAAHNIKE